MLGVSQTVTTWHSIFWKKTWGSLHCQCLDYLGRAGGSEYVSYQPLIDYDARLLSATAKPGWRSYTVKPSLLTSTSYLCADEWVLTILLETCPQAHFTLAPSLLQQPCNCCEWLVFTHWCLSISLSSTLSTVFIFLNPLHAVVRWPLSEAAVKYC